jgi:hypothetical protein
MGRIAMKVVLSLVACLAVSGVVFGADAVKEKKGKPVPGAQFFALPEEITLTAEQQTKLDELKKEHGDKLKDLVTTRDEILTKDQKKARGEAQKSARQAGKKGKEIQTAIDEATMWTEGQKDKYTKAEAEVQTLGAEVKAKVTALLTEEQKAKLPKPKKNKKNA